MTAFRALLIAIGLQVVLIGAAITVYQLWVAFQ